MLIRRKNPPPGWALPGGFVDPGESVATAARREAKEETGLDVELVELLGVYSDPARDPRGFFTVSTVFIGRARGEPAGGDDAAEARVFRLDDLPPEIAFDHPVILDDYRRYRAGKGRPPLDREERAARARPPRSAPSSAARSSRSPSARSGAPPPARRNASPATRPRAWRAPAPPSSPCAWPATLKGCIGSFEAQRSLWETVHEMATAAATRDPRFAPVGARDLGRLDVEISVLSPPRLLRDPADIEIGRHGLEIRRGGARGLLLPQVATDHRLDRETFLSETCRKAGLPPDAWRHPETEIRVFEADVFGEE